LEPLPARLLVHWPLDEADSDTAADASGGKHPAKIVGTTIVKGHDGRGARRFDGDDYLEVAKLGQHEAVSIALWVRAESLKHQWNPLLFGHGGQPGTVHLSLLSDGTPNVAVNTGDWDWTHCKADRRISDGDWHHVVLVADGRTGGRAQFYLDGRLAGQQHLGVALRLDLDGIGIGAWDGWKDQPANNFHGSIDDVRIYSGMLSEKQAADLAGG